MRRVTAIKSCNSPAVKTPITNLVVFRAHSLVTKDIATRVSEQGTCPSGANSSKVMLTDPLADNLLGLSERS